MAKSSIVSPGIVLKEKFMVPFQLKPAQLAKGIGLNPAVISNILNNKQRITLPIALRLSKFFQTPENYWIDLQFQYDYAKVTGNAALKAALKNISPAVMPNETAAASVKKPAKAASTKRPAEKNKTEAPVKESRKPKIKEN
jgi:addiction module HigA family antidote